MATDRDARASSVQPTMTTTRACLTLVILVTALIYCLTITHLAVAPIYGSLLTIQALTYVSFAAPLLVVLFQHFVTRDILGTSDYVPLALAALMLRFPQYLTARMKNGAEYGSLFVTSLTFLPVGVGLLVTLQSLVRNYTAARFGQPVFVALSITCLLLFMSYGMPTARITVHYLAKFLGSESLSELHLTTIMVSYSLVSRSKTTALLGCAILIMAVMRPYLNDQLPASVQIGRSYPIDIDGNWQILNSQWSTSGYVSVLQHKDLDYRLMRCDHSILGGEWTASPQPKVGEPTYAVFALLEAVRLVQVPKTDAANTEQSALVIGLGVGSAPKALIAHGVKTTILEFDPAVHRYAIDYFGLPDNHTIVLQDATEWLQQPQTADYPSTYDFIIHDVFTGGVEPLLLFTDHFLQGLLSRLSHNGVVAINYAGDRTQQLTKDVLFTVRTVFGPSCRAFRDMDMSTDDPDLSDLQNFANLVIFCLHPDVQATQQLTFREPIEADFLDSDARRRFLKPDSALEEQFPDSTHAQLLTRANMASFKSQQLASARRHWKIMREAVPAQVWEKY